LSKLSDLCLGHFEFAVPADKMAVRTFGTVPDAEGQD
jgi:hypothetical protein